VTWVFRAVLGCTVWVAFGYVTVNAARSGVPTWEVAFADTVLLLGLSFWIASAKK
jgi:hypothetical protein